MTSVNNQQYAPYYANYEMPPKPAPDRGEDSAQAQGYSPNTQPDSTSPRQPMPPQWLGRLSPHNGLINPPSSMGGADAALLAKIANENKQLRGTIEQLVAEFKPVIQQLQQQVEALSKQINTPGQSGAGASVSDQGADAGPEATHDSASPEDTAPVENTNAPVQEAPLDLEKLTTENKQLHETVDRLQTQFTAVVTPLQQQIQSLSQQLGGTDTSQPEAPNGTQGSDASSETAEDPGSAEETSGVENSTPPVEPNETSSSANSTVDDLVRQNEQLRTRIDQMVEQFTSVISQLKQQIEQLSAQVKAQAA